MGQKPNDVLYRLENYSFNQEAISTEIRLFETDQDWSIAFDANITSNPTSGTASAWRLIGSWSKAIGGWSISLGKGSAADTRLGYIYMDAANNALTVNGITVGTGRYRFVITHAKNSGSATLTIRKNSETVQTLSKSSPFTSYTLPLYFGYPTDTNKLPTGVINKAVVYNRTLSASEINVFLGV